MVVWHILWVLHELVHFYILCLKAWISFGAVEAGKRLGDLLRDAGEKFGKRSETFGVYLGNICKMGCGIFI